MRFLTKEEMQEKAIRTTDPIAQAVYNRIIEHIDAGQIVTIDDEDRIKLHTKPETYT